MFKSVQDFSVWLWQIGFSVEKYVFNPLARLALRLGIAPRTFALLETTGRHGGQRRLTPVSNGLDGDVFWVISSAGTDSNYVKNLVVNPNARVKIGRRWYAARPPSSAMTTLWLDDGASMKPMGWPAGPTPSSSAS